MSWDIGDVIPLSITIKNASGVTENAGEVSLIITSPDGLATTVSGISGINGVYRYNFTPTDAGRHLVRWVATGINSGTFNDVLDVRPDDNGDFISLTDTKAHMKLRSSDPTEDEKLKGYISAACRIITDRVGAVAPTLVTADLIPRGSYLSLEWPNYPVIAINSLSYLPGGELITEADEANNVHGWKITNPATGILVNTGGGFSGRTIRVTYVAGRNPIPPNFRLAALELTSHLWRMGQLNPGGGRPPVAQEDSTLPGTTYALPYTVRQLLGLDKRPRTGVFI